MASHNYISPYTPDERTRRSVFDAQMGRKPMREVYERDVQKPEFNEEAFSNALTTITVVIQGLCFEGAEGWDEVQRLLPARPRVSIRLFGGPAIAPIYSGSDRATLSLYDPLENLEAMLETFLRGVEALANKAKYFKEATLPFIARAIENSTSEASTAKKIRKALKRVGQFDAIYISSFENLAHMIEEPILELRGLAEFVASIVKEGDEILPHHSPPKTPTLSKSSLSKPSSHLAETKDASTVPTSSPYLTTSLNREPATMASYSGHVKTKSTASQRGGGSSGFEDLLEAAGYDPGTSKKSPSPENESKRESTIDPQYQGSPSYSPPPSPSVSIDILLKPYSVSSIKAEEPSPDISSSILLEPSTLNGFNPSPAPPGTPQWKIDLSERKGHRIQDLHVSPRELDILTRCLTLIHKATLKGEECMRVIVARKNLATEMEREYKQWEDVRLELEANVRIDKEAAQEKMEEDFDDTEADDGDEGQAEDRGRPRDFGMGSQSSTVHMGSPMSGSHCSSNTEGVDVVTHFEEAFEEGEGGDGTDQEMLDAGAGADEGLEQGEITEGPLAGVDEEKEAEDEEMKSGNDDEHPKTRANGKKGLKSGGKVLGLYGEDV